MIPKFIVYARYPVRPEVDSSSYRWMYMPGVAGIVIFQTTFVLALLWQDIKFLVHLQRSRTVRGLFCEILPPFSRQVFHRFVPRTKKTENGQVVTARFNPPARLTSRHYLHTPILLPNSTPTVSSQPILTIQRYWCLRYAREKGRMNLNKIISRIGGFPRLQRLPSISSSFPLRLTRFHESFLRFASKPG